MILIVDGKQYETEKLERMVPHYPREEYGNGITLEGVYRTSSGRVLVVTDSIWDNGRGEFVGKTGHFADASEIACLAARYGGPLLDLVPEGD